MKLKELKALENSNDFVGEKSHFTGDASSIEGAIKLIKVLPRLEKAGWNLNFTENVIKFSVQEKIAYVCVSDKYAFRALGKLQKRAQEALKKKEYHKVLLYCHRAVAHSGRWKEKEENQNLF